MEPFHALHPVWPVATTGSISMIDSGWLHYRDLKSRCPVCKRPAHIAKRDGNFYFVDDEYNPFVRHAPVKTTEAVFRFFTNGYRHRESEIVGKRYSFRHGCSVREKRFMKAGGAMTTGDCGSEKTIRYEEDGWSVTLTRYVSMELGETVASWVEFPNGWYLHSDDADAEFTRADLLSVWRCENGSRV